jgi:hypothetical protein
MIHVCVCVCVCVRVTMLIAMRSGVSRGPEAWPCGSSTSSSCCLPGQANNWTYRLDRGELLGRGLGFRVAVRCPSVPSPDERQTTATRSATAQPAATPSVRDASWDRCLRDCGQKRPAVRLRWQQKGSVLCQQDGRVLGNPRQTRVRPLVFTLSFPLPPATGASRHIRRHKPRCKCLEAASFSARHCFIPSSLGDDSRSLSSPLPPPLSQPPLLAAHP